MTDWPAPGETAVRRTDRYRLVVATLTAVAAAGVVAGRPAAVLSGAFAVGIGAYAAAASPPDPDLAVARSLSAAAPAPGDELTVSVQVHNRGARPVAEVRLRDAVPEGLAVIDGPPRLATTLRPGETATVEYRVRATVGAHRFDPPLVVFRDAAGATERATRPDGTTTSVECEPGEAAALPTVRAVESGHPGTVPVRSGGEGVAFHAVREYRPGDPPARVDWARLARTGDLATVDYREHHAARVVLVVDDRPAAAVAPAPEAPPAAARCREAAAALAGSLLAAGHQVGVATMGADTWVPPAGGTAHHARVRAALTGADESGRDGGDTPRAVADGGADLLARLPAGSQAIVCSPLVDAAPAETARRLDAGGYPTGVVAPDPTAADTPGRRLAALERRGRVRTLRAAGLPVADWAQAERLDAALRRGWSP